MPPPAKRNILFNSAMLRTKYHVMFKDTSLKKDSLLVPVAILLLLWGAIVVFINPVGEFMVNDDWSFTIIIESLLNGTNVGATGWGAGGPSIFSHILWGMLFTLLFGFSATTLRISVLVLAVSSSLALMALLQQISNSRKVALLATLTLVFNPLFLSQSFTYMTDITFVSFLIFSFLFLHMGIEKESYLILSIGLFFALLSLLTRQLGLIIPCGFILTCYLHSKGRWFSMIKISTLTLFLTVVPWLIYEVILWKIGSTPVTSHPVVQRIFLYPVTKGFPDYFLFLLSQAGIILIYIGFFTSPLLFLRLNYRLFSQKIVKTTLLFLVGSFFILEACLIAGIVNPPTGFYKNIIYNFGIGPILLKDIYLLGIQRTLLLSKPIFYLLIFWSACGAVLLLYFSSNSIRQLFKKYQNTEEKGLCFTSSFALVSALLYIAIILLTGFHDRYLIPVCALFIVWFTGYLKTDTISFSLYPAICSISILLLIMGFSIFGIKDFMSTKRSLHKAHQYILTETNVNPCDIDGGFEFNGYHCSQTNSITSNDKYSWWWVNREKFLITLGPLPQYRIVKKFHFSRYLGQDGDIYILQPDKMY